MQSTAPLNSRPFPAAHGFIALTPDPKTYHNLGGRTMLPRSTGTYENHQSRGFHIEDQAPEVFIDSPDPYSGYGGTKANYLDMTDEQVKAAVAQVPRDVGDPLEWAGQVMDKIKDFQTTGQHTTQPPVAVAVLAATPVAPPAAPVQAINVPQFQAVSPPAQPVLASLPQPQVQSDSWEQVARQMMEHVNRLTAALTQSQQQPVQAPVAAQPGPPVAQAPPPQIFPTEVAPTAPPELKAAATQRYTVEELRERLQIPLLNVDWQPPKVLANFFTPFGMMRALYHAVILRGRCLTLIVDSRQDGTMLFIPPVDDQEESRPVRVTVESQGIDCRVVNLDFHTAFGCYDLYNLVLIEEDKQSG